MRRSLRFVAQLAVLLAFALPAEALGPLPCSPFSELLSPADNGPDPAFCQEWNPEFANHGYKCCGKWLPQGKKRKVKRRACAPKRTWKTAYCDEMTDAQRAYLALAQSGKQSDVFDLIARDRGRHVQAQCDPNDGFLAWGRPVVATDVNRIKLRSGHRCLMFGNDAMVGMLEWVGRRIAARYAEPEQKNVRLLVGDISAPRGGCLAGRRGRRGHSSHTTGQDADLGFLITKKGARTPDSFHKQFDPEPNWWVLKQVFANPYACVRVVFLDRTLIRKLGKEARGDPRWDELHRFLRHARGHRNHFHVRVGDGPGKPGCVSGADPALEEEEIDGEGEPSGVAEPADSPAEEL